eukprot:1146425-Pelagomonas_calceolata.AAC.3
MRLPEAIAVRLNIMVAVTLIDLTKEKALRLETKLHCYAVETLTRITNHQPNTPLNLAIQAMGD